MSKRSFALFATLVMAAIAVKADWPMDGRDEIDSAILKTLTLRHGEDIVPSLSALKRDFNISDDAFSTRLVLLATEMTNGPTASFRSAAISILGYFGTTNALEFLEDEALGGGNPRYKRLWRNSWI